MSSPEEMLQDHLADLTHEHQVENCDHDGHDWTFSIDDYDTVPVGSEGLHSASYIKGEIICTFCRKTTSFRGKITSALEWEE